jgi:hypothetical protein
MARTSPTLHLVTWVTAALAAALLAGCGGGSNGDGPPPAAGGDVALAVSQPGEVLEQIRRLVRERASQRAHQRFVVDAPSLAPALAVAGAAAAPAQVIRSDTLVQESGVGEHDLIKSDGRWIYTLDTATAGPTGRPVPRLSAFERKADGSLAAPLRKPLPEADDRSPVAHGLQFASAAQRLAVLGESVGYIPFGDPCAGDPRCLGITGLPAMVLTTSEVTLHLVSLAGDGAPGATTRVAFDGRLVSSRLLGRMLVVVSTHAPRLAADALPADATASQRDAALAALTNDDVLPRLRIDNGPPQPLVRDTDCWLQPANASLALELTTITLVDLSQPGAALQSRCFVGGSEALYMSTKHLYLATTRYDYRASDGGGGVVASIVYPPRIETDIHKFAVDAAGVAYRASGSVAGHLGWDVARKSYRMSEHDGMLRVLSFTGETGWAQLDDAATKPPSPATLTVLRENTDSRKLAPLSTLPNASRPQPLGHEFEQVHAVRFIGARGYLVTFRRTDPLWVLDLADPADPKVAGELQVPGYSDQLYPLDGGLLLGVGRDADARGVVTGLKLSLFDVADATRPRELASRAVGGPGSQSTLDHSAHGLNHLGVDTLVRAALPVALAPPSSAPGAWQHGLLRFEVDLVSRTLATKPMLAPPVDDGTFPLWEERSIQIGDQVHYLVRGEIASAAW